MIEPMSQFEGRKRDHIALALREENEALGMAGFEKIRLQHEALPEFNFEDIQLSTLILGRTRSTPFLVSSMTAGHAGSDNLNKILARACAQRGWIMGVGSQRRELSDDAARDEWKRVRDHAPGVVLLGNLGLSQVIQTANEKIEELVEALSAEAMIVHLNALQECMQPEGTPHFRGGFERLQDLAENLSVPVIVKETGCGFSESTLQKLKSTEVAAVDVSGFGGTHWGRIEGMRNQKSDIKSQVADTFANWGVSTLQSLLNAQKVKPDYEMWASGGVRTGLDAAKAMALGARCVGLAKPILQAALNGEEELLQKMATIEYEFQTALFCTGCKTPSDLAEKKVWTWE